MPAMRYRNLALSLCVFAASLGGCPGGSTDPINGSDIDQAGSPQTPVVAGQAINDDAGSNSGDSGAIGVADVAAATLSRLPVRVTLSGSTDRKGDISFEIVSPPAAGSLSAITPIDGRTAEVTYTPPVDFSGKAQFSYRAVSGESTSDTATVVIDVHPAPCFQIDRTSGPAPLTVTVELVGANAALFGDEQLTWMFGSTEQRGDLATHARRQFTFDRPGVYSVSLLLATVGLTLPACRSEGSGESAGMARVAVFASIRGAVRSTAGQLLADVALQRDGSNEEFRTDADGAFVIPVPPGWSGAVRPIGGVFSPGRREFSNVTSDIVGVDFVRLASDTSVYVHGAVRNPAGTGIAGARVTTPDEQHFTDTGADGTYVLAVPFGFSGQIQAIPTSGMHASPPFRSFDELIADEFGQDFTFSPNEPPVAAIQDNPPATDFDRDGRETVTFDGSSSFDPDGVIDAYRWSVDGQLVQEGSLARLTRSLTVGTHTIRLEVTDDSGESDVFEVQQRVDAAPVLVITPAQPTTFVFDGAIDAPFSPASYSLTLTNAGGDIVDWGAENPAPWLRVIPPNGSLEAGQSINVSVSLVDATVQTMSVGTYTTTIRFSSAADESTSEPRSVRLQVAWQPQPNSPLGTNLAPPDYWSTACVFKNMIRGGGTFELVNSSNQQLVNETMTADADGYPTQLAANRWCRLYLGLGSFGHYPAGDYVALYDGAGTLSFDVDASDCLRTREGRYTFRVNTPSAQGIRMFIKTTQPGNHLRNLRVMEARFEGDEACQWHPAFLTNLSPFRTIRFMDWMRTSLRALARSGAAQSATTNTIKLDAGASSQTGAYVGMVVLTTTNWQRRVITAYNGSTKVATVSADWITTPAAGSTYYLYTYYNKTWSEKASPTYYRQNDSKVGVPVETMVDLCNTLNASPWFCMPTAASDDYVRRFAEYVRDNLKPNLKAYVEYSNETWNGVYPGFDYTAAKSVELGITAAQYHAYRVTQMHQIWSDVFGEPRLRSDRATSRVVRLLGSQAANYGVSQQVMDYAGDPLPLGAPNPFSGGKAAKDYADALTVAFYFGNNDNLFSLANFDNLSVDALLDKCAEQINDEVTRTDNLGWIRMSLQLAQARGLDLVGYEGGQHLSTDTTTPYLRGTVQNSGASSVSFTTGTSGANDAYNGFYVTIESGPGAGQSRRVVAYDGPSRTATLDSAWTTQPTTSSSYLIRHARHYRQDEMNRHPRMKDLYTQMFNGWRNLGVDANGKGCKVFCHFLDCQPWREYGRWGAREYYDQPISETPKAAGVVDFVANNAAWWTTP
ncbi:hypothetical protein RAS1_32620 [Phycisphaerae bacterium RAS1]|nr:hypothetical protein RAS1_32620 [Phycisphaerae bacterium RAS1]